MHPARDRVTFGAIAARTDFRIVGRAQQRRAKHGRGEPPAYSRRTGKQIRVSDATALQRASQRGDRGLLSVYVVPVEAFHRVSTITQRLAADPLAPSATSQNRLPKAGVLRCHPPLLPRLPRTNLSHRCTANAPDVPPRVAHTWR